MGYLGEEQILPTDPLRGHDYQLMTLFSDSASFTCGFSLYSTEILKILFLIIYQIFLKLKTHFIICFCIYLLKSIEQLL